MMKFSLGGRILAVLGLAMALAAPLHAAVTNAAWYRLGEMDPGAVSGGIVFPNSQNSSGVNHLVPQGAPRYTNAVSTTAALAADSSLAVSFDGVSQYLSNMVFTPQVFNFGVEAWVRPASINPGTYYIACYGHPSFAGWSIARSGSQFQVYYASTPVVSGGTAAAGAWAHVAFVRDLNVGTLYVNGVAVGSTSTFLNGSPGSFTIAARASEPVSDFFAGEIDEVRLFNFEPGQFNTNDLLLNQKNVRTLAATSVTVSNATLNGSVYSRDSQPLLVNGWFEWGPVPTFGNSSPPQFFGMGAVTTNFSLTITGLLPGVTYQFRALANISGNLLVGSNRFFTTPAPQVVTLPASLPATLNGSANPGGTNTSAWFEWGTTTNYGNVTSPQAVGAGTNFTAYNQVLSGVPVGVTYHFRAVASNTFAVVRGANQSFYAPPFTLAVTNLPTLIYASTAWGDYDNDGRLDLLMTGQDTNFSAVSQVWRNTGSGFTNATPSVAPDLPGVNLGSVAWGDYDNDGWLDFLLTGRVTNSFFISQLWRNTGSRFTNVTASLAPGLPAVSDSSVAWGDYDNDGRLDFLLTGRLTNGTPISQLWRNTGSGFTNATASFAPDLPGVYESSVDWGDYDNDGRLDLLIAGFGVSQLWRNIGNRLVNVTSTVIPNLGGGAGRNNTIAWGDYDNDGRLDLIRSGGVLNGFSSELFRNNGQIFTNTALFPQTLPGLPMMYRASLAWGDYDNDGLQDILIGGGTNASSGGYIVRVLRNIGHGFTNVVIPDIVGVDFGNVAWGDYDNDGRLDFFVGGATSTSRVTQIWRNLTAISNTPPTAPTGLSINATGLVATLSWNAAPDSQTPAGGLSYNVRIGTVPGGSDILGPSSSASGTRRLPQMGNAQLGLSTIFNYTLGTPYYWSVQAVDGGFFGSPFAVEKGFKILSAEASVVQAQTTNQPAGDTNGDGLVSQTELDAVLANYWPQAPWLFMTNVAGLGGTNVTFALSNSTAGSFTVEYTTNLVDWELLGPAIPRYLFTDTNAPVSPQRSYRLRFP